MQVLSAVKPIGQSMLIKKCTVRWIDNNLYCISIIKNTLVICFVKLNSPLPDLIIISLGQSIFKMCRFQFEAIFCHDFLQKIDMVFTIVGQASLFMTPIAF